MGRRHSLVFLSLAVAACISAPLEHSNYYDADASTKLSITVDVDSIDYSTGIFTFDVTSEPDFPAERPGASTFKVSGPASQLDDRRWMATNAGLFWTPVVIRAVVRPGLPPSADITVWARQRPVDILMFCNFGCNPTTVGATTILSFELRDSSPGGIFLPPNPYRFGTVEVVTPGIVTGVIRGSPSTITLTAAAPGSTWIRLTGEGISDSILVTVNP